MDSQTWGNPLPLLYSVLSGHCVASQFDSILSWQCISSQLDSILSWHLCILSAWQHSVWTLCGHLFANSIKDLIFVCICFLFLNCEVLLNHKSSMSLWSLKYMLTVLFYFINKVAYFMADNVKFKSAVHAFTSTNRIHCIKG